MSVVATIRKEIAMGHRLLGYDGLCAYLHGHNYVVEVSVVGSPNDIGLTLDFKHLKEELMEFLRPFDHSMILNEEDPIIEKLDLERVVLLNVNPSAENLATLIFTEMTRRIEKLVHYTEDLVLTRVRVQETESGWAEAVFPDSNVKIVSTSH